MQLPRRILPVWFALACACLVLASLGVPSVARADGDPDGDTDGDTDEIVDDLPVSRPNLAPKILGLDVRGNKLTEKESILAVVGTKVGTHLSRLQLAQDVRSIWSMKKFRSIQVEAVETEEGIRLVYVVEEKPSIKEIVVHGTKAMELDEINKVVTLKPNSILDEPEAKENEDKIRSRYQEDGFYLVKVRLEIKFTKDKKAEVHYYVNEGPRVKVGGISFSGNRNFSGKHLRNNIATAPPGILAFFSDTSGVFKEAELKTDVERINALYYDAGFIRAKVGPAEIEFSSAQNKVFIHIPIEEGPRYRISRIGVAPGEGHKLLGDEKQNRRSAAGDAKADAEILAAHKKLVKSRAGEWFNRSRMARDLQALTTRYRDMGYAHANVIPFTQIDDEKRTIDVEFRVRPGKKVYIERIEISGNSKTQDKVIRRELVIQEGDLYSHSRIEASRRAIFRLGFFKDVKVEPRKGGAEDASILKFIVAEGSTGTFNVGAGYSTVENLVAQLQVTQQNLFGRGQTLMLQGQLSSLRQYFSLRFVEPYFFDTKWYFSFSVYNSLYAFESFNRKTMGGSLTWGYALSPLWRVFLTYTLEDVEINTSSSGVLLGSGSRLTIPSTAFVANLFKDGITSSMRASLTYDKRDNRQFPTKGAMHSLSAEFARPEFGSQNVFDRYRAFSRIYFPLFKPFILKMNAEIGLITSTDPAGVPIFERFFLGGINTIRGFRPYSLGPKIQVPVSPDPNAALFSFRKGGDKSLVFNWEVEFDILKAMMIKGVVFVDAGNAYDDDENYSLTKMRSSWGFGIRWYTFLGTLRFEWGLPIKPEPGEERIVFEFNIGGSF